MTSKTNGFYVEQLDNQRRITELKKHINAIHCTNSLSLLQRKLFNALLYHAYSDLPHKAIFTIPVKKLCSLIGYNSNDYAKLKRALIGLISTTIEWNVVKYDSSESEKWQASAALAAAKLEEGICEYEYSTIMRELLYHPEVYGRINIELLSKFTSSYGLALYENCIRYQGLRYTPWYPIGTFRKLMGVLENKYIGFNQFKKRVLNIAIDEVNQYSPLHIESEIERSSKKVTSIRFILKNKLEALSDLKIVDIKDASRSKLIDKLINTFSLSPSTIQDIFGKFDLEYISQKVEMILSSENYRLGKIKALAGYLIAALTKDYLPSKPNTSINEKERPIDSSNVDTYQNVETTVRPLYDGYLTTLTTQYFESLDQKQKQSVIDSFMKDRGDAFLLRWINKYGFDYGPVKAIFEDYIRKIKNDEIGYIMSLEEYAQQLESKEAN